MQNTTVLSQFEKKKRQKCSFIYKIQTQWPIIGIPSENNWGLESIRYFIQWITDTKVIFVNKPVTREGSSGEEEDFIPPPHLIIGSPDTFKA